MDPVRKQSVYLKTLFFLFYVGLGISSPYFGIFYKHVVVGKFVYIFILLFFLNCCFYPIMPMIDAETLLFLNRHFRREFYGAHRLWGTYGWSVSSILMGVLLFFYRYDPLIFYCAALAFAVLGFASWSGIEARPAAAPIIIPWNHLKKDILFRWFLLFIFLHGVVTASSFTYTGYFFDDVMKTPLEIGFILGTWTIFEIPVMMFSRKLIDRFGNRWLIVSGLLLRGTPSPARR